MKNLGRMTMHDLARVAPTWSFGSALQQPTQPEYDRPLVLLNNLQQDREEDQRMRVPSALTPSLARGARHGAEREVIH